MQISRAAVALLVWLTACAAPAATSGALPFTTIERKDDSAYIGQQQYFALDPGLLVFTDAGTAAGHEDLFSDTARGQLGRVDWRTQFVVAVFQGWQSGLGHGVTIERVVLDGTVLRVHAIFSVPDNPAGAVTSPYHLIAVRRPITPVERLSYELIVGDQVRLTATPLLHAPADLTATPAEP